MNETVTVTLHGGVTLIFLLFLNMTRQTQNEREKEKNSGCFLFGCDILDRTNSFGDLLTFKKAVVISKIFFSALNVQFWQVFIFKL